MPEVTIDEGLARQGAAAVALLDKLYRDPKVGMKFKATLKELNPQFSIPEIDTAAPIVRHMNKSFLDMQARVEKAEKDNAALRASLRQEKEEQAFSERIDNAVRDFELTDTGRDDLIKVMKERKIADPEAAAAYLTRKSKANPAAHSSFMPPRWNFMSNPNGEADTKKLKSLMDDPEDFFFQETANIFGEYAKAA